MKKLIFLFSIVLSLMTHSTQSYAEWTEVAESATGKGTYYLDFERIKMRDGYVYYWYMNSALDPRDGSGELYRKADCNLFRYKLLSYIQYKKPMASGSPLSSTPIALEDPEWTKPKFDTIGGILLKNVCDYIK